MDKECPPVRCGRFWLLHHLAVGGYGVVHVGVEPGTGRRVAVKLLSARPGSGDDAAFARFEREIEIIGRFSHPSVPALLAHDLHADPPYHVTEYVGGVSLAQVVNRTGALTEQAVLRLGEALCEVLVELHREAAHRDLKPENVLVTRKQPLMIDFGLARTPSHPRITRALSFVGSPLYAAPERLRMEAGDDRCADVYELAGTLLFALTGAPAHREFHPETWWRSPLELHHVPDRLRPAFSRWMHDDPGERPTSAQLVAEIQGLLGPASFAESLPEPAVQLLAAYERDTDGTIPLGRPSAAGEIPGPRFGLDAEHAPGSPSPAGHASPGTAGDARWTHRLDDVPVAIATGEGAVVCVVTARGDVAGIDPEHGVVWRRCCAARSAVAAGSMLFVGARDGLVHVLDPQRGGSTIDRMWVGGKITTMATGDGRVFAAGASGVLCAFSARGHGLLAERAFAAPLEATTSLVDSVLHVADADGVVHALDTSTLRGWSRPLGERVLALAGNDDLVVAATADGRLVALNGRDGEPRWSVRLPTQAAGLCAPFAGRGVAAVTLTGRVQLFGPDGKAQAGTDLGADVRRSVRAGDREVVVGALDGAVYGIDAHGGQRLIDDAPGPVEVAVARGPSGLVVGRSDGTVRNVAAPLRSPAPTGRVTPQTRRTVPWGRERNLR